MKRILITLLVLFTAISSFAQSTQYPVPQNLGNANTLLNTNGGGLKANHILLSFTDTSAANATPHISFNDGSEIRIGDSIFLRSRGQWVLQTSTAVNIPSLPDGLLSVQGIGLVDTTVTISPNIVWRRDNINYTQTTQSVFQINKADTGYSRFDLIYIDSLNVIRLIQGVQDTGVVVPPNMPPHGIQVTIVSVNGATVQQPIPSISTNYWSPDLNNIPIGNANFGLSNNRSLGIYTSGLVRAVFDTLGQLRFPLINNGNYPHALTFYNNVDATVPPFNLAVNSSYGEITLRPTNSGYINGFRMKKSADADSLIGAAYSSMYLQDYGKLKYNTLGSQTSAFEVTQTNTPLFTVNSTTKPGAYFGNDTTYKPSSALTVSSTTQGILVPRMTTTQMNAIGTPSNGLLIYNLDSTAFYFYQLSAWVKLGASSGGSTQDTVRVIAPLYSLGTNHDTLYMPQLSEFDSGWVSPDQAFVWDQAAIDVQSSIKTIVSIGGSSFENTHVDGSKDTVTLSGGGGGISAFQENVFKVTGDSLSLADTLDGFGGSRLQFFSTKNGAFRVGSTSGSQWDVASVGEYSIAAGHNTIASGIASASVGWQNSSAGDYSFTSGFRMSAAAVGGTSVGVANDQSDTPDPNTPASTDRIFQIGNGTLAGSQSNAMTVLRDGKTGFGTVVPATTLHVVGDGTNTAFFMNGNVGIGTTTPFYPLDMADNDSARILKLVSKYDGDYEGFVFSIGNATQSGGAGGDYKIAAGGNVVSGAAGSFVTGDAAHGNVGGSYQISAGFDAFANEGAVITVGGGNGTANGGDMILQGGSSDFGGIRSEIRIDGGHSTTDGKISITGNTEPASDSAYDLGSSSKRFKNIYVTGGSLHVGAVNIKDSGYAAGKVLTITTSNNATWQTPSTPDTTAGATKLATQGFVSRSYLPIANPSATGNFTLTSTTGGIRNASLTTTQMNAIASPVDGEQIWNSTEKALFTYNSDWGWESNDFVWLTRNTLAYRNDFTATSASASMSDGMMLTAGTSATTSVTTDNNHPGIWNLSTSTSSSGATSVGTGNGSTTQPILLGGGRILYETSVRVPTLSTSGERFSFIAGLTSSNAGNAISNGYIFLYDEGGTINGSAATPNWKMQNVNGGSVTTNTSSVVVTAGSWYRLTVIVNAANTSVSYYINGTLAVTETANVSSTAMGIVNRIQKSVGTTARTVDIDYVQVKQRFTTAR